LPNEPLPKELGKDLSLKEFTLPVDGVEFKFKWKPLTWYEEEKIINSCMTIDPRTSKMTIDTAELNKKLILACLQDAPFGISPDNIMALKPEIKTKILEMITPQKMTEDVGKK